MPDRDTVRNRPLAVIAGLLAVAGLKRGHPATVPPAAAVFVVAAAWPIKPWLGRALPPRLATLGTALVLAAVLAGFAAAVAFSVSQVVQTFVRRQEEFGRLYDAYAGWGRARGLPVLGAGGGGVPWLASVAQAVLERTYAALGYLGLVAVLVLLDLPEVPAFRRKLRAGLDEAGRREALDMAGAIAAGFRGYVGVTTPMSLLTGVACAAWAWAVGLELAPTWGVLNLLLNFVPVIANAVGIVPPSLYALVQFGGWTTPLAVFLGYAALQAVISNVVSPLVQGRGLSLSPAAVVVAQAFWGWLWGIAGALLAVPLTAAAAIVCGHFRGTAWIARLLSRS